MNVICLTTARLKEAVEDYLGGRPGELISTHDAIRAIRHAVPACRLDDGVLTDIIALAAMDRHNPVLFDAQNAREA